MGKDGPSTKQIGGGRGGMMIDELREMAQIGDGRGTGFRQRGCTQARNGGW